MTPKICETCRYWSERVAFCEGGGPLNALCLSRSSPQNSRYTTGGYTCDAWAKNTCGAVDDPSFEGTDPYEGGLTL